MFFFWLLPQQQWKRCIQTIIQLYTQLENRFQVSFVVRIIQFMGLERNIRIYIFGQKTLTEICEVLLGTQAFTSICSAACIILNKKLNRSLNQRLLLRLLCKVINNWISLQNDLACLSSLLQNQFVSKPLNLVAVRFYF